MLITVITDRPALPLPATVAGAVVAKPKRSGDRGAPCFRRTVFRSISWDPSPVAEPA